MYIYIWLELVSPLLFCSVHIAPTSKTNIGGSHMKTFAGNSNPQRVVRNLNMMVSKRNIVFHRLFRMPWQTCTKNITHRKNMSLSLSLSFHTTLMVMNGIIYIYVYIYLYVYSLNKKTHYDHYVYIYIYLYIVMQTTFMSVVLCVYQMRTAICQPGLCINQHSIWLGLGHQSRWPHTWQASDMQSVPENVDYAFGLEMFHIKFNRFTELKESSASSSSSSSSSSSTSTSSSSTSSSSSSSTSSSST